MYKQVASWFAGRPGGGRSNFPAAALTLVVGCVVLLGIASCGSEDEVVNLEEDLESFIQKPGLSAQYLSTRQLPYSILIPLNYDPDVEVPLILALHHDGAPSIYLGQDMLLGLIGPALGSLEAILVAPIATSGSFSNATAEADILALLDAIRANYNISSKKTVLVGYSMGGAGVWYMAKRHPSRFAGAIAIAAQPPADVLDTNWQVPLLMIHSQDDGTVAFDQAEAAYNGLSEKNVDVALLAAIGLGHEDVNSYAQPLSQAVPWILDIWGQ